MDHVVSIACVSNSQIAIYIWMDRESMHSFCKHQSANKDRRHGIERVVDQETLWHRSSSHGRIRL